MKSVPTIVAALILLTTANSGCLENGFFGNEDNESSLVSPVWKKGDFFQPLGMKGTQKISDFLINEKVDRISKVSQHVCTADEEIFWVCGKRISNWARITKDTFEMAKLTYKYL